MTGYTIADFVAESGYATEGTREHYRKTLTRIEQIAGKPLANLAPSGVVRLMTDLRKAHPASIGHDANVLRMFYRKAGTGYEDHIKRAKAKQRLKTLLPEDILSVAEIQAMVNATQGTRDRALIACLYETGVRISELLSLNLGRVARKEANGGPAGYVLTFRKVKVAGEEHRGFIFEAEAVLGSWLKGHPTPGKPDAALFCTFDGRGRLSRGGAWSVIEAAKVRAKITKKVYPHLFRHSRASHLLARGTSEAMVKKLLGWKQNSSMLNRYAHVSDRDAEEAQLRASGFPVPAPVDYERLSFPDEALKPIVPVATPPGTPAAASPSGWVWVEERHQFERHLSESEQAILAALMKVQADMGTWTPEMLRAEADRREAAEKGEMVPPSLLKSAAAFPLGSPAKETQIARRKKAGPG